MTLQEIFKNKPIEEVFKILDAHEKYFEYPEGYAQIKLDYTNSKDTEANIRQRLRALAKGERWDKVAERLEILEDLYARYTKRLTKKINPDNKKAARFEPKLLLETNRYEGEELSFEEFYRRYEKNLGHLKQVAIVGEAGAGKTVILLKCALGLIEKARLDADCPIPIILNLATWQLKGDKDFADWLKRNLQYALGQHGTTQENATAFFINDEPKIWLLDGLDEVPENDRLACVEDIRQYIEEYQPEYMFCCRREEYNALKRTPQASMQITIKPLTAQEVGRELKRLSDLSFENATRLCRQVQDNPAHYNKLTTPFEVEIALEMAGKDNFSLEDIQDTHALVRAYIAQETSALPARATEWLSFLARQLQRRKKGAIFELADMQPNWSIYFASFRIAWGILLGAIGGIASMKFFEWQNEEIAASVGAVVWIATGFAVWILAGISIEKETKKLQINTQIDSKTLFSEIFAGIGRGILLGAGAVLVTGIIAGIEIDMIGFGVALGIWLGAPIALGLGVCWGIAAGISHTLFSPQKYPKITQPYARFYNSFFFNSFQNILLSLLFVFGSFYFAPHSALFVFSISVGLFLTLFASPLPKHLILRVSLYSEGKLPLFLVSFLRKVEKTGLMERDGGQWRFRHRLVQDTLCERI